MCLYIVKFTGTWVQDIFFSILSIKCASRTYINLFDMLRCEISSYVKRVHIHFIDKIEEKKSWTEVPVVHSYNQFHYVSICTYSFVQRFIDCTAFYQERK